MKISWPGFLYHPTEAPYGKLFQTDPGLEALEAAGWVDTPDKFPVEKTEKTEKTEIQENPESELTNPDPGDTTDGNGLVDDASIGLAPPKKRGRPKKGL